MTNISLRNQLAGMAISEAATQLRLADDAKLWWELPGSRIKLVPGDVYDSPENIACLSYAIADAMIAQSKKKPFRRDEYETESKLV